MSKKEEYDIIETTHGAFKTTYNRMYLERKPWVPVNPKHILSPIPGTVIEVMVKEGQLVKAGDILVIYKAMKMNNKIRTIEPAKIKKIHVQAGENLPSRALMIELE